jgi:hypothetical protein
MASGMINYLETDFLDYDWFKKKFSDFDLKTTIGLQFT